MAQRLRRAAEHEDAGSIPGRGGRFSDGGGGNACSNSDFHLSSRQTSGKFSGSDFPDLVFPSLQIASPVPFAPDVCCSMIASFHSCNIQQEYIAFRCTVLK